MIRDKNFEVIEVGMTVLVPPPDFSLYDSWNHEFQGQVKEITTDDYIIVEDGLGDCFTVEPERLEIIEE